MSLSNLKSSAMYDEPINLWKTKQRVHYHDDVVAKKKNQHIPTDVCEYITISAPNKSASFSRLPPNSLPSSVPGTPPHSAAATSNQVIRYARTSCDHCGHHSIPVMSPHPISPLAKSQTNLDVVEHASQRQALLPMPTIGFHRDDSACTLQVSRRPSLLLQEILTQRPPLFGRKDGNGFLSPRAAKGNLQSTASGSTATINLQSGTASARNGSTAFFDNGAKGYQAKQQKEKNRRTGNDAISSALSATYCKLLVLLGVCLPITEVISEQIPTYVYQGFYVYLYVGSILFVIFLYISAFRNRSLFNALKDFHEKNSNVHLKHKVTHFGSFYLRVGAIAFAIGTMVYSGLEFGQFFELNGHPGCRDVFVAITPICRMVLCIAQVQFIFLNTTFMDMARHKVTSRFGLMHMVATNLCEWLYVLVEETKHEIFHISHHDADPDHDPIMHNGTHGLPNWSAMNESMHHQKAHLAVNHTLMANVSSIIANVTASPSPTPAAFTGCSRTTIMGALVQQLSPFLFPCTIEYSLICAVILYEMWKTVKSIPDIDKTRKNSVKPVAQKPAHHFSVDCSQSHKGLFFGILIIVMTIIAMIMYFVLYSQPGYELVATQEVTLWETFMYFMCAAAVITGMFLMRDLRYIKDTSDEHHSMDLDNLLLIVAQTGVYLYGLFSILGSYFAKWDTVPDRVEGIIAEVFGVVQTSLQTMFILHASHRRCKGAKQVRRKPGREIITFLLVANIAIWFVNTLIKGRAVFRESHLEFFGVWGWTIITHISMPLAIFYRFHSTICLFEVWKVTYKAKAH
ncbi:proton channel OtopLc isoform X1 [Drosophila guanche]|uniref:Blast:Otopetrin-2 n=2 Tax=Drosophila guanche TaxID=7266 RepID=A0A3B0K9A0_DROGU|nr:proton channel OtopLc isoform X1 [Drosophila guanche]SPP82206.1 blast:Otopetrin-2 [Drosophila guanche]